MKKRISKILIFVIMFILLSNSIARGAFIDDYDDELILFERVLDHGSTQTEQEIISELKANFGYNKDKLTNPIRLKTKVTILRVEYGKYIVKIGDKEIEGRRFSEDTLKSLLGYEGTGESLDVNTSWDVVIDASVPESFSDSDYIEPGEFARSRSKI